MALALSAIFELPLAARKLTGRYSSEVNSKPSPEELKYARFHGFARLCLVYLRILGMMYGEDVAWTARLVCGSWHSGAAAISAYGVLVDGSKLSVTLVVHMVFALWLLLWM